VDALCLAPSRVLRLASACAAIDAAAVAGARSRVRRVYSAFHAPLSFTDVARSADPRPPNEMNFLTGARGIPPQKAPRCTAKLLPRS